MKYTNKGITIERHRKMRDKFRKYQGLTLAKLREHYKANLKILYSKDFGSKEHKKYLIIESQIEKAAAHCLIKGMPKFDVNVIWPIGVKREQRKLDKKLDKNIGIS